MMSQQQPVQGTELITQPKQPDKSLGELVSDMTVEVSSLMRKEMELAKVELKEEVGRAGKAGGMLGGGALAAYFALLLDEVMPRPLAFLLVAVIFAIAAAVLISRGRQQLKQVDPVPRQTVETLKEDVEWAKAQKS